MIRSHLRQLRDFLRGEDFRHYLLITGASFAALIVLSFLAGLLLPGLPADVMAFFSEQMAELGVVDENGNFSVLSLFGNNTRAMVLSVLYGFIPFLYLPALSLGVNAMLLGLLAAYFTNSGGSLLTYLAGILPHGIFELPALIVSLACGIYLCACVNTYIRKNIKGMMLPAMKSIARTVVCIVMPLLALAAVTEAYVTPAVLRLFL